MLSVASLLNPVQPEPRGTRLPSSPSSSLCTLSSTHGSPQLSTQSAIKKQKMNKDGAIFAKGKIKGEVNFPPFEDFDEATLRGIQKFQVYPLGKIQEYSRHIPYNSEKKSFLEKTGRESFEVFQYVFKVAGDEKEYTVMWDYNIGLVRITPFFKCCKYSKTTPAKMLNMNPGLKEITHSITGGALAAQGYWMPYSCALAICTTFCSHISPALIPIFGPSFPALCVLPEAPEHGRMIISPQIVRDATLEAESYRLQYNAFTPRSSENRDSFSPRMRTTSPNSGLNVNKRLRLKRAYDYDTEGSETSGDTSSGSAYHCSPASPGSPVPGLPLPHSGWRAQNQNHMAHSANAGVSVTSAFKTVNGTGSGGANPILSAIPRSSGLGEMHMGASTSAWRAVGGKRRAEEVDGDEVDGEDGCDSTTGRGKVGGEMEDGGATSGVEKKAAWLLMKLSVKDGEAGAEPNGKDGEGEGHRAKRMRATSM